MTNDHKKRADHHTVCNVFILTEEVLASSKVDVVGGAHIHSYIKWSFCFQSIHSCISFSVTSIVRLVPGLKDDFSKLLYCMVNEIYISIKLNTAPQIVLKCSIWVKVWVNTDFVDRFKFSLMWIHMIQPPHTMTHTRSRPTSAVSCQVSHFLEGVQESCYRHNRRPGTHNTGNEILQKTNLNLVNRSCFWSKVSGLKTLNLRTTNVQIVSLCLCFAVSSPTRFPKVLKWSTQEESF